MQPSTCAPLCNLVQPSTCAPLCNSCSHLFVHHCSISCTSCPPLVHLSCTSNHCRGTSRSLGVGTSYSFTSRVLLNLVYYSISCTTQSHALLNLVHLIFMCLSCASRAPLILVNLSCTNPSRAPLVHLQSLSWDFLLPGRRHFTLVHSYLCSNSCTNSCSCTHHQAHSLPHST